MDMSTYARTCRITRLMTSEIQKYYEMMENEIGVANVFPMISIVFQEIP